MEEPGDSGLYSVMSFEEFADLAEEKTDHPERRCADPHQSAKGLPLLLQMLQQVRELRHGGAGAEGRRRRTLCGLPSF